MIRTILCALDASERAPGVFDAAAEVARAFGARLWLLRVVAVPPDFPPAAKLGQADPLPTYLIASALEDLRHLAARAAELRVERPVARSGTQPWRTILESAAELDVDLIVMGSHGYHGVDRILGTTAAKVANLAHRNVMVVHNRAPAE